MEHVLRAQTVDGHEHLLLPSERVRENTGFFEISHYIEADLYSAGAEIPLAGKHLEGNIDLFLAHYPHIKNTACGKTVPMIFELYGMDGGVNEKTLRVLDGKIRENSQSLERATAWYDEIFKKCGVAAALSVHSGWGNLCGSSREYPAIRPVAYLDFLLRRFQVEWLRRQCGSLPNLCGARFQDYLDYTENFLTRQFEGGVLAGKFGTPYWRSLDFGPPGGSAEAEAEYNSGEEAMPYFESFIFHYLLRRFEAQGLPVQFHTGHVTPAAADMPRYQLQWSDPSPFGRLAYQYPGLKFVLLHTGFPFQEEYFSLVKNIPNIYADFSWIPIISPMRAKLALHMALEMVPCNKIIGFGGDAYHVEALYAHLRAAKAVIGEVLSEKVRDGWFTEAEAKESADKILYENPREIYGLGAAN
jgi:hypothetical protein